MRILIEKATTVHVGKDIFHAGETVDVEESIGEALCKGHSARLFIEYRPDALKK
jgi:hypothetical protein